MGNLFLLPVTDGLLADWHRPVGNEGDVIWNDEDVELEAWNLRPGSPYPSNMRPYSSNIRTCSWMPLNMRTYPLNMRPWSLAVAETQAGMMGSPSVTCCMSTDIPIGVFTQYNGSNTLCDNQVS